MDREKKLAELRRQYAEAQGELSRWGTGSYFGNQAIQDMWRLKSEIAKLEKGSDNG